MTDHAHELRRHARKIAHPAGDVPAVMLAAADEIERLRTESAGLVDDMNLLRDNNTALRAKVAEMERQKPVATVRINVINGNPSVDFVPGLHYLHHNDKLYALPGAKGEEK